MTDKENRVAIHCSEKTTYPNKPPFNPPERFPEYPFGETDPGNSTYPAVREVFRLLGMDSENYGTSKWNPLGGLISPGDKVVIKPNLVLHKSKLEGGDLFSVIVHPSVLRPLIDYAYIALKGQGKITIADAPLQSADFKKILDKSGLLEMVETLEEKIEIVVLDLRQEQALLDEEGFIRDRIKLAGDPEGYVTVDLKEQSELSPIIEDYERFWVTNYDLGFLREHHNPRVNEYLISKTILDADVVISVPKLKTHRKVGVTLSLKNTVGIVGDKSWLPHHRIGALGDGGDEFPQKPSTMDAIKSDVSHLLMRERLVGRKLLSAYSQLKTSVLPQTMKHHKIQEGDWYGNDTIWRMVLDLNRILLYAGKEGLIRKTPQRKYFTLIDGIVAGEGEGPLMPTPKECGILIAGYNPVSTDVVASRLMGFDYEKIRLIKNAFKVEHYPLITFNLEDITINSNRSDLHNILKDHSDRLFNFTPSYGWRNHIEV